MNLQSMEVELCKWILSGDLLSNEQSAVGSKSFSKLSLKRFSLENLNEVLQMDGMAGKQGLLALKLRLALHFSPREAVYWDTTRTESRMEIVREHLIDNHNLEQVSADTLARSVVKTLKDWQSSRQKVREHLDFLLEKQNYKCACCNIELTDEYKDKLGEKVQSGHIFDPYKPIYDIKNDFFYLDPEVDHIEPVSGFGLNNITNLQVLCRLCNQGKGDGLGFSIKKEHDNCYKELSDISWGHKAKMFYFRLEMDAFSCTECNSSTEELTIKPIREAGAFLLTNLKTVCVKCLAK
jgi:5-methylcytosine-specific restriction endonuclease McrA